MDFENEIEKVAERYEEDGYAVIRRPGKEERPSFAADYEVDLLARKGDQGVLVEVRRNRHELSENPRITQLADITNNQPDWRFDLVVVEPDPPGMRSVRGAAEPTPEQIERMLHEAELLVQANALMSACMLAWAAFEASMRRALHQGYGIMPNVLLRSIYASGTISKDEFSLLDEAYKLRTQVAHGFVPATMNARLVNEIVRAARHLLTEERQPEPAAS